MRAIGDYVGCDARDAIPLAGNQVMGGKAVVLRGRRVGRGMWSGQGNHMQRAQLVQ